MLRTNDYLAKAYHLIETFGWVDSGLYPTLEGVGKLVALARFNMGDPVDLVRQAREVIAGKPDNEAPIWKDIDLALRRWQEENA